MHYIDYKLDGIQPFRITNNVVKISDGLRLDIEIYGDAVIAIESRENWWLDELTIKATSGKMGAEAEGFDHEIEAGSFFFETIKEYLNTVARDDVEAAIEAYAVDYAEQSAARAAE